MSHRESDDLQQIYLQRLGQLRSLSAACGAGADSEDVLQDIWLRLQEGTVPVAGEIRHPGAYLARMVVNAVSSCMRRSGRRDRLQQEIAQIMAGEPTLSSERILAGRQAVEAVREQLASLPERTRGIFLMRRVEGRSHTEIAALLGVSEQTVHYHMRRAISHLAPLRETIYEKEPGSDD